MKIEKPWDTENSFLKDSFIKINANVALWDAENKLLREESLFHIPFTRIWKEAISMEWGRETKIALLIGIKYNLMKNLQPWPGQSPHFGKGSCVLIKEWIINYDERDLKLSAKDHPEALRFLRSPDTDGDYSIAIKGYAHHISANEKGIPEISVILELTGTTDDKGMTLSIGPIGVPIGGDSNSNKFSFEFRSLLNVSGQPEKPETKEIIKVPIDLLTHNVYFANERQTDPGIEGLRRIEDEWYTPLRDQAPDLYRAIKNGYCPIYLHGHASTTGSDDDNLQYSTQRINFVAKAIEDIFNSKEVTIIKSPKGENDATQQGPVTRERRVEIIIRKQDAKLAIATQQGLDKAESF